MATNTVIISGRLTKDIDIRQAQSGMTVGRFTLAVDRGKDSNGNDRGADFINCVAFGRTAEAIQKWTGKGKRLLVNGHIQTGSYDKDGTKVYTTDVIVDRMEIIDFNDNGSQKPPQKQTAPKEDTYTGFDEIEGDDDDDGIPF